MIQVSNAHEINDDDPLTAVGLSLPRFNFVRLAPA